MCDELLETSEVRNDEWMHRKCRNKLKPVGDNVCYHCGRPVRGERQEYCHDCTRGSIFTVVETEGRNVTGICYTDKKYGPYVEFGTGPKGQENHEGISPDTTPVYTQSPWWIHEGSGPNEVDRATAEKYGWFYIDTPEGRFYQCTGQPAQPFLYPALKNNEKQIEQVIREELRKQF